jgi:hypothetical protein
MQKQQEELLLALFRGMRARDASELFEVCSIFSSIHRQDRGIILKILHGLADEQSAKPANLRLVVSNPTPSQSILFSRGP